jgi:hypothetical protein
MVGDVRGYHLRRSRTERTLAYQSGDERISNAHMTLSALHLRSLLRLERELVAKAPAWSSCLGAEQR